MNAKTHAAVRSVRTVTRQIMLIYFLTFAARGLVLPFANLYLKDSGFSGTAIGTITGIGALVQLTLTPLLNTWADRAGQHRRLLGGLLVANSAALAGLLIGLPGRLWLGGVMLLRNTVDRPSDPLLSQLTLTWLNRHKLDIYGRLRGWGSLGWGVLTLFSGRIYALGGYSLLFGLAALLNLVTVWFIRILPAQTTEKADKPSANRVPRQRGFYLLLVSMFLYSVGMVATYTFMFIYFEDSLGASKEMIGILSAVAALAEVPSMMLIDRLLRRVQMLTTLIVGLGGMIALWAVFTFLNSTTLLIPLMIVRGTFYTLQTVSLTLLIARISDPANAATNQSLMLVTVPGLAVLLTGSLSGWVYDDLGARTLFLVSSMIGGLSLVVLIVARRSLTLLSTQPSQ